MDKNTSNATGTSQGDQASNPQAQGANSTSQGEQSTPTVEALLAKVAKLENEAFEEREKKRKRKEQEQEAEAARLEQLKRNGEFEALTKQQQSAIDELKAQLAQQQTEIAKRDYDALRAKVATKHGLPAELATRLVGVTEEDLEKDAAQLKKLVPVVQPGNAPGPKPSGAQTPEDLTKAFEQRMRASGKYHV